MLEETSNKTIRNIQEECRVNFIFSGSKKELEKELLKIIEIKDINKFINGITKLAQYLNWDDEYVKTTTSIPEMNPDIMQYLIPNTNYNINLKAVTITILAAVLDVSLTKGFANLVLLLGGFNSHAIVKLDEYRGEKCIILEMLKAKSHTVTESILPPDNKECFNCNLNCKHRTDSQCKIKRDDIHEIFKTLLKKNIITNGNNNGEYKYNY